MNIVDMNKVGMKKVFAISALSLAIAVANGAYAESKKMVPEDCVVEGGQGESLAEWGMWCGVGSFLAALSEMAPTAAGPEGPGFDSGPGDPTGRGEADDFDPQATREDEPEDPVDEPVPPHIVTPEGEGEFVGYFASQDSSYESDNEPMISARGVPVVRDIENHQTGGFDLSLEDGYGDFFIEDNGYGDPDTVQYARYDRNGDPIDGNSFSSANDGKNQKTTVFLGEEAYYRSSFDANRSSITGNDEDRSYTEEMEGISGKEVVVYQEYEDDMGSKVVSEVVLKSYWAGHFSYNSFHNDHDGTSTMSRDGAFVAGVYTALAEIQTLISGDVSAVYTGNSHQWRQPVRLEVDFGDERFSGEFGDMDPYRKGSAGIDMAKDMSFTAEGVIQGIHLISESVSADDGFVQGTFFGDEGRIVGGAYDITKQGDRVVDVFTAVEGEGNRIEEGICCFDE